MLHETYCDSVRIISLDRNELLAELSRIAGQIRAAHPEVADLRIFGSLARGDQTGTSDVDILIVLREPFGDPVEQARRFYSYFDLPVGVDLLVLDGDQVLRRQKAGDPFIRRVWQEGVRI